MFNDLDAYNKIMLESNPKQCKNIGKTVKDFDAAKWDAVKQQIVFHATYEKFSQNYELHRVLILTGNKTLAEASPYDKIWGIGLIASEHNAKISEKWEGQNLLGQSLMEVRHILDMEDRRLEICELGVHAATDYPDQDN